MRLSRKLGSSVGEEERLGSADNDKRDIEPRPPTDKGAGLDHVGRDKSHANSHTHQRCSEGEGAPQQRSPRRPHGSNPRSEVKFTRRQSYGWRRKESLSTTEPLPDATAKMVQRLSNPPGYIPTFMRRDKEELEGGGGGGNGLFGASGDMFFDGGYGGDNDER